MAMVATSSQRSSRDRDARRIFGIAIAPARRAKLALIALLSCAITPAWAQAPCDPLLRQDQSDQLGYRARPGRCEGRYLEPVAGHDYIALVSLFAGRARPDPAGAGKLALWWRSAPPGGVHIRAVSLRNRFYYRMDRLSEGSQSRFDWPTDVLRQLDVRGGELGILAWLSDGGTTPATRLYVPVAFGPRAPDPPAGPVVAQIIATTALKKVFVTVERRTPSGGRSLVYQTPPNAGPSQIPSRSPLALVVLREYVRGDYRVQITGTQLTGPPLSLNFQIRLS